MSRAGKWSTQATVGLILVVLGLVVAALLALSIPAAAPLHPGGSSGPAGQVAGTSPTRAVSQHVPHANLPQTPPPNRPERR